MSCNQNAVLAVLCYYSTTDDPEDDGVAQDGGDHDEGEAEGPDDLVRRPRY